MALWDNHPQTPALTKGPLLCIHLPNNNWLHLSWVQVKKDMTCYNMASNLAQFQTRNLFRSSALSIILGTHPGDAMKPLKCMSASFPLV